MQSKVLVVYTLPYNSKTIKEEYSPTVWERMTYVRYYKDYNKTIGHLLGTMWDRVILGNVNDMSGDFLKFLETRINK